MNLEPAVSHKKKTKKRTGSQTTPPRAARDFVAIADRFAREAIADVDHATHCHWIRLAASRYLKDRKRAATKGGPFKFSLVHANDVCDFVEKLPHVEGRWDTATIVLHPAHVFFLVNLFGFRNLDGTRRFTSALLSIGRKNAKALALDTPIPTPRGWRLMRDIESGDVVFGADGRPCRVVETSEVFIGKPCYRVSFSDGTWIVASGDHQWETIHRFRPWAEPTTYTGGRRRGNGSGNGGRRRVGVLTTEQIAQSVRVTRPDGGLEYNHAIAVAGALETPDVPLPFDPYMLGAWLGDGTTMAAQLTCGGEDVDSMLAEVRRVVGGAPIVRRDRTAWRIGLTTGRGGRAVKVQSMLRRLGVLGNKHIPDEYLWAGTEQRRALLRGLMDTDGTVTPTGLSGAVSCAFTSTKRCLADGVLHLARSLGIKATFKEDVAKLNGRVIGPKYLVQFTAWSEDCIFHLPRKAALLKPRPDRKTRSGTLKIIACEKAESVPTKCLMVDSADHLFLAGRGMVPTHNSLLAAAILLYCLCCEDEPGPQVISAATTGSQARIVFNAAKRMVEMTPDLREMFSLEAFANAIANWQVGGNFRPINAKASTQDGLNPSHVVLDEIHAHKSHDLLNVLQSAAGARLNALWLYTTTEGYETPGPWPEMRHYAQQVLNGILEADHFFALIFSLDEQVGQPGDPNYRPADEDFDESKWKKANPLMDVNPILEREIRKAAIDAKQMPGRHAEFKIKRLNRASSVAQGWTNLIKWKMCGGAVDLAALRSEPCWGGLDLAATSDLASYRLVWKLRDVYYTKGWRWVPRVAIKNRTERGLVPYAGWIQAGHLIEAGDEIIDYDAIFDVIVQSKRDFNLQKIGYDDWNVKQLLKKLLDADVPMQEFIQGPKSFHPAMKRLEEVYVTGKLHHGGDPVLAWCASNLVARTDINMNTAPDKKKSVEKIDDMVALLMAIGISLGDETSNVYNEQGIFSA